MAINQDICIGCIWWMDPPFCSVPTELYTCKVNDGNSCNIYTTQDDIVKMYELMGKL